MSCSYIGIVQAQETHTSIFILVFPDLHVRVLWSSYGPYTSESTTVRCLPPGCNILHTGHSSWALGTCPGHYTVTPDSSGI